jgi:hypothetical protein
MRKVKIEDLRAKTPPPKKKAASAAAETRKMRNHTPVYAQMQDFFIASR